MSTRHINAEHVLLALVARRAVPSTQWAAISNGFHTYLCTDRKPMKPYCYPHQALMLAILPCTTDERLLNKVRWSYGAKEIKATWGMGYRQILAENKQRRERMCERIAGWQS